MSDNGSGGMTAIIAIVAVIAIAIVGYFAVMMLRETTENEPGINVNLGGGDANGN